MPDLGPLGHSRPSHRVHGWCSHCHGRTVWEELAAWQVREDALADIDRGYCPNCGRGDCSPTAEQWLTERQRAESAEAAVARTRAECVAIERETDEFEARHNPECECEHAPATRMTVARIRAALEEPKER
ncbi:hypothetical protein [Streptomyces sp. NPDC096153]|uniref:hypothetical protein n=1 Tax=Streptomyces sp. NPDC096153 TaxID=3155548 RepID=UPI003326ACC7